MKDLFKPVILSENNFYNLQCENIDPDRYKINCIGVIFDVYMNNYEHILYNKRNGYYFANLYTNEGHRKSFLIHRLVAYTFCYKPIDKNIVNHKDGNKINNHYLNLEWVTMKENVQHALSTGLHQVRGEANGNSILTDKQVHIICKLLEQGINYSKICEEINLRDSKNILDIITKIRAGKLWKHISSLYNIPEKEYRSIAIKYTSEQIHSICKLIEEGYSNRDIANLMNIDISENKLYDKYLKFILRIRRRETYTDISKNYNW